MRKFRLITFTIFTIFSTCSSTHTKELFLLRDDEIEKTIKLYINPILKVASINPKRLKIKIIIDKNVNAAIIPGNTLIINTGLLIKVKTLGELIGVLAHEIAHLAGDHTIKKIEAINQSSKLAIASLILGTSLGIGTNNPDVALGAALGGYLSSINTYFDYSQNQESHADQLALKYLDKLNWSAIGYLKIMKYFQMQELNQAQHFRTHPFTKERITVIQNHISKSPFSQSNFSKKFLESFNRLQAKLIAFLDNPENITKRYTKIKNKNIYQKYSLSIAYFRKHNLSKACYFINELILKEPNNPYFWELKGQILFENGEISKSLEAYKKAESLIKSKSGLILLGLAQTMIASNTKKFINSAIKKIHLALLYEKENSFLWYLLAVAEGRNGRKGRMSLALAEKALLKEDFNEAFQQANRAKTYLKESSPGMLRAQDILLTTSPDN